VKANGLKAKIKLKNCKVCPKKFRPWSTLQIVCSTKCAIKHSKLKLAIRYAIETRKMKKEFRSNNRSYQLRKAQNRCNEYIRIRDMGNPCISCGTTNHNIQYAAGHFKSVGSHPELRFHPFNINRQCNKFCNTSKSGNAAEYRIGLIEKIGLANVEWLEGPHDRYKLTLDDIKDINAWYKCQYENRNI